MLQVNNHSPYRKYFVIAGIVFAVIGVSVGAFLIYRYVTSDPMGETTYKRSTPSVRTYEPTPEPSTSPKPQKSTSPSPKPTHTPVLNQSPTRTRNSPAPTPSASATPSPTPVASPSTVPTPAIEP